MPTGYLQRGVAGKRLDTSDRATHDHAMAANAAVPCRAYPLKLNILETSLMKPLYVLFLRWEKHPGISKEPREPEGWVDGSNHAGLSSYLNHSVGFLDTALWFRPVLDTENKECIIMSEIVPRTMQLPQSSYKRIPNSQFEDSRG